MIGRRLWASRFMGLALAAACAFAPAVRAGVNTWTGGRPTQYGEPLEPAPTLIATDPRDPYVVYAVFQPNLYKSSDGGRSWRRIGSFLQIYSLLVHPAAPETVYVGVTEGADSDHVDYFGVSKSSDGGRTWVRKPFPPGLCCVGRPGALAGSPADPNTVLAGTYGSVFKSTDGGESWTTADDNINLAGAIASLTVSPRDSQIVYSGTEADYYYFAFARFAWSVDGGATWGSTDLGRVERVGGIAVDPGDESRVFVGLAAAEVGGVRRSDDRGRTFTRADSGLPSGVDVTSLVIDPAQPSTLYAGTNSGLYRSQDSGGHWWTFGKLLAGRPVDSLAISSDGHRLHAGTVAGAFDLELASGPVDVAATPGGGARVLRWSSDRRTVQTVDGSTNWTASPFSDSSLTWTGVAVAQAPDGTARVLWQNGDGRWAVETVGGSGAARVFPGGGSALPGDVAVGSEGSVRLLWRNDLGAMSVMSIGSDGVVSLGPRYAQTPGWTAIAIDTAPDGRDWVLWRSADGRAAVSVHVDGVIVTTVKWGATDDWSVEDLTVASDGRARVLARTAGGSARIWIVGEDGSRTSLGGTYDNAGLVPRRIAAGGDGLVRLLWGGDHGEGSVWFVDGSGNHVAVDVPVIP